MMVCKDNLIDRLIMRAKGIQRKIEKVEEFVSQGYISKRLGVYAQNLLVLDHLADESKTYALLGDLKSSSKSLGEMRIRLGDIGTLFLVNGKIESEIVEGVRVLANPEWDNIEKYKGLFDFAYQKYSDVLNKCEEILGVS